MSELVKDREASIDFLFDALIQLGQVALLGVADDWASADDTRRAVIWAKARSFLKSSRRTGELDQAKDRVARWTNDWNTGRPTGGPFWQDIERLDARAKASAAVLDAVVSILADEALLSGEKLFLRDPLKHALARVR